MCEDVRFRSTKEFGIRDRMLLVTCEKRLRVRFDIAVSRMNE